MGIAHNDLQRALAHMTVGFHKQVETRRHAADRYKLTEREQQFQIQINGRASATPTETKFTIPFSVYFVSDAGMHRASSQGPPQIRTGWEFTRRPSGLLTYAHAVDWTFDDALYYSGCKMIAGAYMPAQPSAGVDSTFSAVLHVSFQGWGVVWDGDDDASPDDGTS